MRFLNIFSKERKEKLDNGLEKTKKSFLDKLSHAVVGKSTIDDDVLDSLEETLLTSDVGVDTTLEIINRIKTRVALSIENFIIRSKPICSISVILPLPICFLKKSMVPKLKI